MRFHAFTLNRTPGSTAKTRTSVSGARGRENVAHGKSSADQTPESIHKTYNIMHSDELTVFSYVPPFSTLAISGKFLISGWEGEILKSSNAHSYAQFDESCFLARSFLMLQSRHWRQMVIVGGSVISRDVVNRKNQTYSNFH